MQQSTTSGILRRSLTFDCRQLFLSSTKTTPGILKTLLANMKQSNHICAFNFWQKQFLQACRPLVCTVLIAVLQAYSVEGACVSDGQRLGRRSIHAQTLEQQILTLSLLYRPDVTMTMKCSNGRNRTPPLFRCVVRCGPQGN